MKKNKHTGSSFDDFLKEEDLYEEEAIENVKNGIFEDDDSDTALEDCIKSKDHNVINEEDS